MKLLVVIPAFNEGEVISSVLTRIPKKISGISQISVLVVDDGSVDFTAKTARKAGALVVRHEINRGLGAALATGFRYAKKKKFEALVTLDADGQHDPKNISKLIKPILKKKVDVVIGSRMNQQGYMPISRKIVNWFSNLFTWALFGIWTSDSQSGFRLFNKRAIEVIQLRSERMEVSSEILKEIRRNSLKLQEVSIKSVYTVYSLRKGQQLSNATSVMWRLLLQKFS